MILLMNCSLTKSGVSRGPARDVYTGDIVRLGLEYAARQGWTPMFLSGKYGIITPDTVIDDYDYKMKKPFDGPWPTEEGFWLGSAVYFANAPPHIKRLLPKEWSYGQQKGWLNRILHPERYGGKPQEL